MANNKCLKSIVLVFISSLIAVQSVFADNNGFFVRIDENGRPIAEMLPQQSSAKTLEENEAKEELTQNKVELDFEGETYEDADEVLKKPKKKRFYTYINELGQLVSVEE